MPKKMLGKYSSCKNSTSPTIFPGFAAEGNTFLHAKHCKITTPI